jgi:hypothetical protein
MDIDLTHPGPSRRRAPDAATVTARGSATAPDSATAPRSGPARPRAPVARDREVPFGISTAIGSGAMLVALLTCALVPGRDGVVRMTLLCTVLTWFAASSGDVAAVAAVLVVTCLVGDGFLVNREGLLSWHGWPDVWRVAGLGAAAVTGLAVGRIRAWLDERRRFRVIRAWS